MTDEFNIKPAKQATPKELSQSKESMKAILGKVGKWAAGALPNGTRIEKINSDETDAHQDGATGTIVGSIGAPYLGRWTIGYFVEWDDMPGVVINIVDTRVRECR